MEESATKRYGAIRRYKGAAQLEGRPQAEALCGGMTFLVARCLQGLFKT